MHVPCLLECENTREQFLTTAVDDKSAESEVVVLGRLVGCKASPALRNVLIEEDVVIANDDQSIVIDFSQYSHLFTFS